MKVLLRVATAANLKENGAALDELLMTESWQTLITFAQETVRESFLPLSDGPPRCSSWVLAAPLPTISAPTASGPTAIAEDIPPALYEQFAQEGDPTGGNIRICPHCTFENTHGGNDCEVCGLPL